MVIIPTSKHQFETVFPIAATLHVDHSAQTVAFVGSAASFVLSATLSPSAIALVEPFNAHSATAWRYAVAADRGGGLVQSVFSLPARGPSLAPTLKPRAPRRQAKNALQKVARHV